MEIVNIVVSGSFNQKVDLQALMALGDVYSYDPEKYHGGYIRLSSAKVTIYQSGKYIIYGIKSLDLIQKLWEELVSILFTRMDVTLFEPPVIKNMVAKDDIGRELPLDKLQKALCAEGAEYEPEVFPGLMWTTEHGSANIFKNGKFMLLGCKTVDELEKLDAYVKNRILAILNDKK